MIRDHMPAMRARSRACKGGEWDAMRAIPLRVYRQLCGAGYVRRDGDAPDVFAEAWNSWHGSDLDVCAVVERWARECLREIAEVRRECRQRYERRIARACGVRSYFAYRDLLARLEGFASYRAKRTANGWQG